MRYIHVVLAATVLLSAALEEGSSAAVCTADDIANAVDEVGSKLRAFNSDMMAALNPKLKQLQAKRGWSDVELAAKTQALVADDEATQFDRQAFEQGR